MDTKRPQEHTQTKQSKSSSHSSLYILDSLYFFQILSCFAFYFLYSSFILIDMVVKEKGSLCSSMNCKILGKDSTKIIVLAHGFGADQSVWDKILPYLTNQQYQVVVFDWTFSGAVEDSSLYDPNKYSSYDAFADDLIGLLDELSLKSVIFVGHSMSGMIGCIASIKRPELFGRLILVATSPRYLNADDYEGGFEKSDIEEIISNIEFNYQNWAKQFASLAVDSNDPLSVDKFEKCLSKMRPEVALALGKTVFYVDERKVLEKVVTPSTIIQTKSDLAVPNTVAFYMQKMMKGKSTVEIINSSGGHYPQLTAHLEFLDVLGAVLGF